MKITKSKDRTEYLKMERIKANEGCNVCPCCGQRDIKRYEGIEIFCTKRKGLFSSVGARADFYVCPKCGSEWESDPYEWY